MCSFCAGPDDEGHWRVQGFTAGRLIRMQCAHVTETEARQELRGEDPLMTMIVFAALTGVALAISWGTVAAALRQSQQGQVSMDEATPESGLWITPAHLRLW